MLKPATHKRRAAVIAAAALACLLYLWQTAGAWRDEQDLPADQGRAVATLAGSTTHLDLRAGMAGAVASDTSAIVRVSNRIDTGELLVRNLPMLPPSQIYRLWGIDTIGTVDHAADFNTPFDSADAYTVPVITAQALTTYRHFVVTIEPAASHDPLPTGRVVMSK